MDLILSNFLILSYDFFLALGGTLVCAATAQFATNSYTLDRVVKPPDIINDDHIPLWNEGRDRISSILYISSLGTLAGCISMVVNFIIIFSFSTTLSQQIPQNFIQTSSLVKIVKFGGYLTYSLVAFAMGQWAEWFFLTK